MFSNNSFDFGTDFKVKICSAKTGKLVKVITAREIQVKDTKGQFADGGIAVLGQNYAIQTEDNVDDIIPYEFNAVIGSSDYVITSKSRSRENLSLDFDFGKHKSCSILYLE